MSGLFCSQLMSLIKPHVISFVRGSPHPPPLPPSRGEGPLQRALSRSRKNEQSSPLAIFAGRHLELILSGSRAFFFPEWRRAFFPSRSSRNQLPALGINSWPGPHESLQLFFPGKIRRVLILNVPTAGGRTRECRPAVVVVSLFFFLWKAPLRGAFPQCLAGPYLCRSSAACLDVIPNGLLALSRPTDSQRSRFCDVQISPCPLPIVLGPRTLKTVVAYVGRILPHARNIGARVRA